MSGWIKPTGNVPLPLVPKQPSKPTLRAAWPGTAFPVPFAFGTAMGLGCVALTAPPSCPAYPEPLTAAQSGAGLSAPAAAIAILGK
jgi:hypothetical protein